MTILIPSRAVFAPGDDVEIVIEHPSDVATRAEVTHLDQTVASLDLAAGTERFSIGALPEGGYGVTLRDRVTAASIGRTALDVLESRWQRPRYGFVVTLDGSLDPADVARLYRRAHLSAALFYDWAYRHSQLLPPERMYVDPLGQPRDLEAVNAMARGLDQAGVAALGYAAVYAIGPDEVAKWDDAIIRRPDGSPYRLGDDFLVLVDPAHPRWLSHMMERLTEVIDHTDLHGFHLDQFGWPKFARLGDGTPVSLAASFETFLTAVREALPASQFMFNNVNDFPTTRTARLPQDATYVEVWEPHTTLGHLGQLATRALTARPDHPLILSAYLASYTREAEAAVTDAGKLVMASAVSHGATHLLLGEAHNALTDPYYPRNHQLSTDALEAYVPWYDFAVRYGDLFYGAGLTDVTTHMTGGINEDVVVAASEVPSSVDAAPGTLWTRVVDTPHGLVVHIINLASQSEIAWDAGKAPVRELLDARLRIAFADDHTRVMVASPDAPDLVALERLGTVAGNQTDALTAGQGGMEFALPALREWTVVVIRHGANA